MSVWWMASSWGTLVEVEVVKTTAKQIHWHEIPKLYARSAPTVSANDSQDHQWFRPTREEAKAFLVDYRMRLIKSLENNLEYARAKLLEAEAL